MLKRILIISGLLAAVAYLSTQMASTRAALF